MNYERFYVTILKIINNCWHCLVRIDVVIVCDFTAMYTRALLSIHDHT